MHNNLDKFVREKFQNREFEFKDTYWEEAARMIGQDERWKFWKSFSFAAIAIGIFFAGGIGGYWLSYSNQEVQDAPAVEEPVLQALSPGGQLPSDPVSQSSEAELYRSNDRTDELFAATSTTGPATTVVQGSKGNSNDNQDNVASPTNIFSVIPPNEDKGIQSSEPQELANKSILTPQALPQTRKAEAIQKPSTTGRSVTPLSSLAIINSFLPMAGLNRTVPLITNPDHPVIDGDISRWSVGILAGASGMFDKGGKSFTGTAAGFSARYKFRSQWSIHADVLYRYRPGKYSHTGVGGDITYSFGKEESTLRLQPTSLHYIELPVYLQYQLQNHYLEAGVSAAYLSGVRGGLSSASRLDANGTNPKFEIESKNWIEDYGFKKTTGQILMGYHYGISKNATIGIRAHYTVGGLLNSSTLPKALELEEQSKMYVNLMAKFYLF